ncbi:MAG TPA: plastocyanin/azurin family copper-binding protein [Longimicrobiaceae bacterium]|nr:plastocyanin/azurin family copper-binding protein [Longimicrobiaceae bacterium]
MNGKRVRVLLAVAAAVLGSGAAAACSGGGGGTDPGPTTGSVVAQVSAAGAGVPGAAVAISGGAARTTGSNGQARFDNLQAGGYTLTLQQLPQGFAMGGETAGKTTSVTAGGTATVSWTVQGSAGGPAVVRAQGTSFSPETVTIPAGGTVRFEWVSGSHTVTPENPSGSWVEHTLASDADSFSVTFATPGTYRFRCRPHSSSFTGGMVGVVTVQ